MTLAEAVSGLGSARRRSSRSPRSALNAICMHMHLPAGRLRTAASRSNFVHDNTPQGASTMKKIALAFGAFGAAGAIAVCPAIASGPILVKAGQTVYLPCSVNGAIDIAAGGSVYSDCEGQTTIGGSVDVRPGGFIDLCNAHITGSFLAKGAAAGSYIELTTIAGANRNDGSVGVGTGQSCGQ
jgi:hypothetical protein